METSIPKSLLVDRGDHPFCMLEFLFVPKLGSCIDGIVSQSLNRDEQVLRLVLSGWYVLFRRSQLWTGGTMGRSRTGIKHGEAFTPPNPIGERRAGERPHLVLYPPSICSLCGLRNLHLCVHRE